MKEKTVETVINEKISALHLNEIDNPVDVICDLTRLISSDKEFYSEMILKPNPLEDERIEVLDLIERVGKNEEGAYPNVINKLLNNIKSIVIVVRKADLKKNNDRTYQLSSKSLEERYAIVEGEKIKFSKDLFISKQRSANSLGTGFLFKKREKQFVVTAGHVIFPPFLNFDLDELRFIRMFAIRNKKFGNYEVESFTGGQITIPESDVFKPKKQQLISDENYALSTNNKDYAILEIESEDSLGLPNDLGSLDLENLLPKGAELSEGQHVYGLGHGFGLPLKLSPNGRILNSATIDSDFFMCELDFFSGNSGSPVFDCQTHQLVGMLIRGQKDLYVKDGKVIPGVLAKVNAGEICQKIDFLHDFHPPHHHRFIPTTNLDAYCPIDELVPFTFLEGNGEGDFRLFLCFNNKSREVIFPAYPSKTGIITTLECFLDRQVVQDAHNQETKPSSYYVTKSYFIKGPLDVAQTNESIEVKIYDFAAEVEHTIVLDFMDAYIGPKNDFLLGKDLKKDVFYWRSYFPSSYYDENEGNMVNFEFGYFPLQVEAFNKSEVIMLDSDNILDHQLINEANKTSIGGRNPKPTSIGGRNPKPTSIGGRNPKPNKLVEAIISPIVTSGINPKKIKEAKDLSKV